MCYTVLIKLLCFNLAGGYLAGNSQFINREKKLESTKGLHWRENVVDEDKAKNIVEAKTTWYVQNNCNALKGALYRSHMASHKILIYHVQWSNCPVITNLLYQSELFLLFTLIQTWVSMYYKTKVSTRALILILFSQRSFYRLNFWISASKCDSKW